MKAIEDVYHLDFEIQKMVYQNNICSYHKRNQSMIEKVWENLHIDEKYSIVNIIDYYFPEKISKKGVVIHVIKPLKQMNLFMMIVWEKNNQWHINKVTSFCEDCEYRTDDHGAISFSRINDVWLRIAFIVWMNKVKDGYWYSQ